MHWDGYTVFSVISGVALVLLALAPSARPSSRVGSFFGGVACLAYGVFVAKQTSGTYYFPVQIFIIPFVAVSAMIAEVVSHSTNGTGNAARDTTESPGGTVTQTRISVDSQASPPVPPPTIAPAAAPLNEPAMSRPGAAPMSQPAPRSSVNATQQPWRQNLPEPLRPAPTELLAVSALMALAGAFLLVVILPTIPDIFRFLGGGSYGRLLGDILALVFLLLGAIATAFLLLAWRMVHADRVARGLSYVLLASFAGALLLSDDHSTWLILTLLACLGAIAVLAWSPNVRTYFVEHGKDAGQPTPVVVARTLVAWWGAAVLLVGVLFLPLAAVSDKYVVAGLLFIVVAVAAFLLNGRLAAGDPVARQVITAIPIVLMVACFIFGSRSIAVVEPLAISIGVACFLWVPASSRELFDAAAAAYQRDGAQAAPSRLPTFPWVSGYRTPPGYQSASSFPPNAGYAPPPGYQRAAVPCDLACARCAAPLEPAWLHCSSCGADLATAAPGSPSEVSVAPVTAPAPPPEASAAPVPAPPPAPAQPTWPPVPLAKPSLGTTDPVGLSWTLHLDTGDALEVDGLVLIGRDPAPEVGETADHLVIIDDEGMSVSRTHVACRLDQDGFWVVDRDSTNGVAIESPAGRRTTCVSGARTRVAAPARVFFGDRWFAAPPAQSAPSDAKSARDGVADDLERTQRRPRMPS